MNEKLPDGSLVREKARCTECLDQCQIKDLLKGGWYSAYYVNGDKKLCRKCAKALNVI